MFRFVIIPSVKTDKLNYTKLTINNKVNMVYNQFFKGAKYEYTIHFAYP